VIVGEIEKERLTATVSQTDRVSETETSERQDKDKTETETDRQPMTDIGHDREKDIDIDRGWDSLEGQKDWGRDLIDASTSMTQTLGGLP
jgi:hypothetical protein